MPRGRACRRARRLRFPSCVSIPQGCRSSAARCCSRWYPVSRLGWVPAVLFVALGAFFAFFFRDPERSPPVDSHGGRAVLVAGRRPRAGGRTGRTRCGAARRLAADQHFSFADGRAREPHAGVRAGHPRQLLLPAGSFRRTAPMPRAATSAARSGSITAARWSSRARSSASSRAASSAALKWAPRCAPGTGSAS